METRAGTLAEYARIADAAQVEMDRLINEAKASRDRSDDVAWGRYVRDGSEAMSTMIKALDKARSECDDRIALAQAKYERTLDEAWAQVERTKGDTGLDEHLIPQHLTKHNST